jgi:hypothetical protein
MRKIMKLKRLYETWPLSSIASVYAGSGPAGGAAGLPSSADDELVFSTNVSARERKPHG